MKGLFAAPHTPFDPNGKLWLSAIERQAKYLACRPVRGVFVGGSTGESTSLTLEERRSLCDVWSHLGAAHSLQVIFHVGTNCLPDAVELAEFAAKRSVDAIAAFAPHYFRPNDIRELIAFLQPIAAAAPELPFYFYDIPSLTHVELSMLELLERVRESIPSFAGLKYTNSDVVQLKQSLDRFGSDFDILFGCDELLLAGYAAGAQGAVGSTYNFASELYQRIIHAFAGGDLDEARQLQALSVRMIERLAEDGFLAASKAVMKYLGVDCGEPRWPIRPLTTEEESRLFADLERLECLDPQYQSVDA